MKPLTRCAAKKSARWIAVLLLGVVQAGVPGSLLAQASGDCDGPRFRDFDYWKGTWTVENVEGERIGTNTISSVSDGCALLEQWESVDGSTGTSINHYDPVRGRWEQRWVGGSGLILRLTGQLEDDVMVLTSTETRDTPRGPALDRISWIPEGEAVRQLWEISVDDGESWQTAFEGIYRPVKPSSGQVDGTPMLHERRSENSATTGPTSRSKSA